MGNSKLLLVKVIDQSGTYTIVFHLNVAFVGLFIRGYFSRTKLKILKGWAMGIYYTKIVKNSFLLFLPFNDTFFFNLK